MANIVVPGTASSRQKPFTWSEAQKWPGPPLSEPGRNTIPPLGAVMPHAYRFAVGDPYVKRSPATTALVPAGVVTCTSTVPVPAGLNTVQLVPAAEQLIPAPAFGPKLMPVAPDRFVPVMVTVVAPPANPLVGEMLVIAGPPPGGGGAL